MNRFLVLCFACLVFLSGCMLQPTVSPINLPVVSPIKLVEGANVQLPFTENGGSVAHDISGNGNDCAMPAAANPLSWSVAGYNHVVGEVPDEHAYCQFTASKSATDASESNSRTRTWCGYLPPINAAAPLPAYNALFGSSRRSGEGAFWLAGPGWPRGAYYAGSYAASTGTTWTADPLVGWHCVTETLGSSVDNTFDRFYYDGIETSYASEGQTWDFRAAGDFDWIGNLPWNTAEGMFEGFTSYVVEYPFALTPLQVQQNSLFLHHAAFELRGKGDNSVAASPSSVNSLVCNGDSLANESPYNTVAPCSEMTGLDLAFDVQNIAKAGQVTQTIAADVPFLEAALIRPSARFNLATNESGINDFLVQNVPASQVLHDRVAWGAKVQALGYKAIWLTLVDNTQSEASVMATNTLLRANAMQYGVVLVDVAEDPCLGSLGASKNLYGCADFGQDGTHMLQAGADSVRNMMANIVNYLTGATSDHPTQVNSATYALQPRDAYVAINVSGGIILPSCVGYSATTPFTLATGVAVTSQVSASQGQSLDGGGGRSIAPGVKVIFTAAPLTNQQGGCAWTSK